MQYSISTDNREVKKRITVSIQKEPMQYGVSTVEYQCNTVSVLKITTARRVQYITAPVQYNNSIVEECKFSTSVVEYQKRTVPVQFSTSATEYQ
jgi:hypothetical protein